MKETTTSQESSLRPIKQKAPPRLPFTFPSGQFCSSRSHWLLRAHHKLLRTISGPSLSLWKVPAVSLAVSANRSIPSHVAFLTWLQVRLPTQQIWAPISKVKADKICPPCHSRSSVILQQSIVRGKRRRVPLPKCKDSVEPAHRMKHSCKTLPCDSLSQALSQCHPANTRVKGELLTPALIHDSEGAWHTAACDQEG